MEDTASVYIYIHKRRRFVLRYGLHKAKGSFTPTARTRHMALGMYGAGRYLRGMSINSILLVTKELEISFTDECEQELLFELSVGYTVN